MWRSPRCSATRGPPRSSARSPRSPPRPTPRGSRGCSGASEGPAVATMPASRTIPDLIDELAATSPDREALVGSGQRYTYRQLRAEVRRIARGLHAPGVRRGDKVAILMGNRPEWLIADFAI